VPALSSRIRFDFSGTHVLVTGGSNGIGLGVARAFSECGAEVTITGRKPRASDYPEELGGFHYRQAEMLDSASVAALTAGLGRLDVLINNAGGNFMARDEWLPEVFDEAVRLNLLSHFQLAMAAKPLLAQSRLEGGGSVVNMASMSAFRAVTVVPGYGAAKAAVVQMTKNMGVAWARENVRVNCVAPGIIWSQMTAVMKQPGMEHFEQEELARTPMGRWGHPDDVAPAFLFLASPAARFITGQTLCVDGGYSAF
jgi:NAD(P)-dependent dehydrogenase (short-subunit alcohol dehydrogenase family)